MCLIVLAWQTDPARPLVVGANRDEFYHRPTRMLQEWPEQPGLYAGKDLREGGTWLGITRRGRFAAVTNVREAGGLARRHRSRGQLVLDFLRNTQPAADYLDALQADASAYGGFNLLLGDRDSLWYFSNRGEDGPRALQPGIYGLSNASLDHPWPKVVRSRQALRRVLEEGAGHDALVRLLHDRWRPADPDLPETGVGSRLERLLAPAFIRSGIYGTRASTALTRHANDDISITEQNYWRYGIRWRRRQARFRLSDG